VLVSVFPQNKSSTHQAIPSDALATDPVQPDNLYLAVGLYSNYWDPKNGTILKSADRGNTFTQVPLPFKVGGNMPGRGLGERLAVDPNDVSRNY
jgi:xyloglucan-specific exo-beta-1,4-glucanase